MYMCPMGLMFCSVQGCQDMYRSSNVHGGISRGELSLNNILRMLWEQHVYWTRMTIMGIVEDLPDVDLISQRLLRNPNDFANALRPFYGDEIAAEFVNLFTSHLAIAAELVKAANMGNSKAAADAEKRWYANADEIAGFLGRINPFWSAKEWKRMLDEHLALTKTEAVNMINQNYAASIAVFDEIEKQALMMADMMVEGIVRQFPNMFR